MDPSLGFAALLGIAQGNQTDKTLSSKHLQKKLTGKKDKGKPAPNVRKFLENKEKEERKKRIEEKLKLQALNEARSQAEKNKISKHLKVTKSSNKSVLHDALDHRDTAHTLQGRKQCDEDDYGFASKTSQGIYEKLMSKYEADPEDPMAKFSKSQPKAKTDLSSAKERVKEALKREAENSAVPGRRRSRINESERAQPGCIGGRAERNYEKERGGSEKEKEKSKGDVKKEEKVKAKSEKERKEEEARRRRLQNAKKAPPPIDFQSLLEMANHKKDIPVKVEKKKVAKESEFGDRPMTEQEKKEYMRENEARLRREGKLPPREKKRAVTPDIDFRDSRKSKAEPGPSFHQVVKKSMPESSKASEYEEKRKEMERKKKEMERQMAELEERTRDLDRRREAERRDQEKDKLRIAAFNEKKRLEYEKKKLDTMQEEYKEMQRKMKEMEARLAGKSKRDVGSVQARSFPGERGYREQESRGGYSRRIDSDSEEDEDDDLDGFIDDSDAKIDISKEIRSIFGYDKRKYHDEDFDDRSMENNKFSSIMMEEARSARIGRQEDLEDIRREEEENKRKRQKMKRR